ncbi:MAG: hypothetical protein MUF18_13240, partial [Fimbriiglobus sp.]|nr:hypothetical protein [Fimbriiglobus sp.]
MKLATPPRVIAPRREPVRIALGTNDPRHRIDLRGRVALLTGVVAFVVLQLGIHTALQSGASTVSDPIYAEKLAAIRSHPEFFAAHSGRHRLLAIGSSRTQLCLNAERLTNDRRTVFNFGAAGCGP